jgi:putative PEP-CTERM system TPR-repeat lipoprotein
MKPNRPTRLPQRLRLLPIVMACAIGLAGADVAAQPSAKAAGFYEDALVRYEKKDMPGAIIQLKNALQIDPTMLPVQLLLGKALMRNGDVTAAEVALSEALRLGVNRAEVVVLLGQSYMAQGKHQLILTQDTFKPAGLPPGVQFQLHLLRATVQGEVGEANNALQSIAQARAIDNGNVESWLTEIPIRIRARQFGEATAASDRAIAIAPELAEIWYQKGSIAQVRGNKRDALAAYDRTLQIDPAHVEGRLARIGIFLDLARYPDAAKDVEEVRRQARGEPRAAYFRALLAERYGNEQVKYEALKEVTNLLDPVPLDYMRYRPQLLMLNGLAHYGLRQSEKAKQYLEAFQRVQNNSPVSKLLAKIYLTDGNATTAVNVLEGYLRAQPGDGQALTLLASAHMALGRHAKATSLMQDALKSQDNPSFRTALGLSLLGDGKVNNGMSELEISYQKNPQQIQTAMALVQLYLSSGQSRKALPIAERLAKRDANNIEFLNLLGMAQGQTGNFSAARATFGKAIALDANAIPARLNLARLEIANKSFDTATTLLNTLLSQHPSHAETMYELAVIAERRGQPSDAQRWLEKARDASVARDVRWDLALVDFHLRNGNTSAALDAAKLASGKAPENLRVLMAYSRAQLASGDTVAARSSLTGATRFAEYNAPLQVEIATLQMAANNVAGAAYSLDKALANQPNFLPAHAMMVDVEIRQGELAKAEKRAKDILAQHPRLAIGHTLLGDLAMARNQGAAAIDSYRRAHQVEKSSRTLLRLFYALSNQEGDKAALPLAEQWLKQNPRDLSVVKALGDAHARAGNLQAAKTAYESGRTIKSDDAELLNNLANVQILLKDPSAVKTAEAALAIAPGNALLTDTLGWALFQNGQSERALQLLRDARLRQPDNPEIRYHLAVVLAKAGRTTEARSELETALKASRGGFESAAQAQALLKSLL